MTTRAYRPAAAAPSLYDYVGARLEALIPYFDLDGQRATIGHAYRLLCRESLQIPTRQRPLRASRLNADGTPFQFAFTVGWSAPGLQLVTDTGPPHAGNAERGAAARRCFRRVGALFGATEWLGRVFELLDEQAPLHDPDLLADAAGPFWIGAAFAPERHPSLKIYVNARWGTDEARWARLAAFAESAGIAREWKDTCALLHELEPLGISLTLSGAAAPKARIYLSGYGKSFGYYEALATACAGPAFAQDLRRYGQTMLGVDYRNPTRSVVWSLGSDAGSLVDYKLELCGHCAFESDARARARCTEWLREVDASPALYLEVLDLLSKSEQGATGAKLHAYVGVGANRGRPYSTFYFNPAAGLP